MNLNPISKPVATAQAEAALLGATLAPIEDDTGRPLLVLTRDAFTAQLNSVEQVHRVLADLGNDVEVRHGQA